QNEVGSGKVTRVNLAGISPTGKLVSFVLTLAALLTASAIQNAEAGYFTNTGNMGIARSGHTATLLANGKVLLAGGADANDSYTNAVLYDFATEVWTATGSMTEGRQDHTATLLPNGKVLVAGGAFLYSAE